MALFFALILSAFATIPSLQGVNLNAAAKEILAPIQPGKQGLVVVFLSAKCPCSNSHISELNGIAKAHPEFAFVAVHSNSDETPEMAQKYFRDTGLPFPVIQDAKSQLADELKAFKTPHVFVFDPSGKIQYQGGVTSSAHALTAEHHYLSEVLEDLAAGKAPRLAQSRTLGCVISRERDKNVW